MARLLILTSSFPRWQGDFAGCFVGEFAQALTPYFDITILAPPSPGVATKECINGIRIYRFNYLWPTQAQVFDAAVDLQTVLGKANWRVCWQILPFLCSFFLRALFLARQADIICSHWLLPAGLLASAIAGITHKPHICIEHSGALHLLTRLKYGQYLARLIMQGIDKQVVVSKQLRERLIALCPMADSKIVVLPMGIKYHDFAPLRAYKPHYPKVVLFLGRLTTVKGVAVLLQALKGCKDLSLWIAGEGEERKNLEAQAREMDVAATFLGAVDTREKQKLLEKCDLVVIPSIILPNGRTEGLPVVCLEAFAAARAVIASDVGGLREILLDGESGLLFPAGDVQQLREKIIYLLKDDTKRENLGKRASLIAQEYDWSKLALQFKQLLCR